MSNPLSRLEVLEIVSERLALALCCLRMSKGSANGLIDQAAQDALDLYENANSYSWEAKSSGLWPEIMRLRAKIAALESQAESALEGESNVVVS